MRPIDWITCSMIDPDLRVPSALGPGLFEGHRFENAFVLDLLVDSRVVVEIESVERLAPLFESSCKRTCGSPTAGLSINRNEMEVGGARAKRALAKPTSTKRS